MKKKTAIIGATTNRERYAFLATNMLQSYGHPVVPLGIRTGSIGDAKIVTDWPEQIEDLDTITLYIGPRRQPEYYDYLISLHPKRIVFNPGTENRELIELAQSNGIETVEACTLVMLRTGQF